MRFSDLISETLTSLLANKMRSFLTVLGIVVGIGSVIAMLALGEGASASITDKISSNGANLLTISSQNSGWGGAARDTSASLTMNDVSVLKESTYVDQVIPTVSSNAVVAWGGNSANASVIGTTGEYTTANSLTYQYGTGIDAASIADSAKVVVLGDTINTSLFGENVDPTGEKIRIGTMIFTVTGKLAAKESGRDTAGSAVLMPYTTAQRFLTGSTTSVSSLTVVMKDEATATDSAQKSAKADITASLLASHGIASEDDADFQVSSMADLLDTMTSVTNTLVYLLAAIASISLVVGGIGVMNMMLTNVAERKSEIGLRKSLGAEERSITQQFLSEAIALSLVGGLFGIIIGWAIATVGGSLLSVTAVLTPTSILLATGVCISIGVVFGYYPARKAAKLNPIEALRYQ